MRKIVLFFVLIISIAFLSACSKKVTYSFNDVNYVEINQEFIYGTYQYIDVRVLSWKKLKIDFKNCYTSIDGEECDRFTSEQSEIIFNCFSEAGFFENEPVSNSSIGLKYDKRVLEWKKTNKESLKICTNDEIITQMSKAFDVFFISFIFHVYNLTKLILFDVDLSHELYLPELVFGNCFQPVGYDYLDYYKETPNIDDENIPVMSLDFDVWSYTHIETTYFSTNYFRMYCEIYSLDYQLIKKMTLKKVRCLDKISHFELHGKEVGKKIGGIKTNCIYKIRIETSLGNLDYIIKVLRA